MANTVTTSDNGNVIEISAMDSDYDAGSALSLTDIQFIPGAAGDIAIIKTDDDAGPILCRLESLDGEPRIKYFHTSQYPYVDYSAGTYSTGAKIVITKAS